MLARAMIHAMMNLDGGSSAMSAIRSIRIIRYGFWSILEAWATGWSLHRGWRECVSPWGAEWAR